MVHAADIQDRDGTPALLASIRSALAPLGRWPQRCATTFVVPASEKPAHFRKFVMQAEEAVYRMVAMSYQRPY